LEQDKADLTLASSERLFAWLGPDREQAEARYAILRRKLVLYFSRHRVSDPENLADETFFRAIKYLQSKTVDTTPEPFLLGVARNILLEEYRRPAHSSGIQVEDLASLVAPNEQSRIAEEELRTKRAECMQKCLSVLLPQQRELILKYYSLRLQPSKFNKEVEELASHLGINMQALYVRIHRIKQQLSACLDECVEARGNVRRTNLD